MIGNPLMLGSADYQITRSLRFRSSASAYLSRTPASAGNRKTWTWSAWVKRGTLGAVYPGLFTGGTTASDAGWTGIWFNLDAIAIGSYSTTWRVTTSVYRDPSSWYHIVVAMDTTQATANNRVRLYVNGSEVTAFSTTNNPTQNTDLGINQAAAHTITYQSLAVGLGYFDGYMAEVNFIDGQALTPGSFGETDSVTGVWLPKKFTGTYGTNGFYLPFTDNSGATSTTIGKDYSVNGNNWTPNNISVTAGETYDSMTDVPTLTSPTAANYCVLNPLSRFSTGGTLSNGNLTCALSSSTGNNKPTIGAPSGKWYAEFTISSLSGQSVDLSLVAASPDARSAKLRADYCSNGQTYNYGTSSYVSYGAGWAAGDVIGVAWDLDANQVTFYRNGTSQGTLSTPSLGTNASGGDVSFTINNSSSQSVTFSVNFGQRPFAYTPPSGFVALNTFNLPTPAISAGNKQMDAILYTGDGTNNRTITSSLGFTPGLAWGKSRSAAFSHALIDSVRGNYQILLSNSTNAEATNNSYNLSTTNTLITWDSNETNKNGSTYVAWLWKANGAGSSNTAGSITSTVSANTTSGFSVVTYTGNGTGGATIGHGLGVAPSMVIVKRRDASADWTVYHVSLGNTKAIFLSGTYAPDTSTVYWNNTTPTSSVFTSGSGGNQNASGGTYVAYCFAPIAGFSAFGSYTGNGSTDGPFIYTGFRPRWIMCKSATDVGGWTIMDTSRVGYNANNSTLYAEALTVEQGYLPVDILSNGFKIRTIDTGTSFNSSGQTYIYACFAENPFKYSLAR